MRRAISNQSARTATPREEGATEEPTAHLEAQSRASALLLDRAAGPCPDEKSAHRDSSCRPYRLRRYLHGPRRTCIAAHFPALKVELLPDQPIDLPAVSAALGLLHHGADDGADRLAIAGADLLGGLGVGFDRSGDDRLQLTVV